MTKKKIKNTIRIYGTETSIHLLNDPDITQYFIDETYRCVPHSIKSVNVLILLIGYNKKLQIFELCLIATMNKENLDMYKQFYLQLKTMYNFKPKIITCDFNLSNINAINEIFSENEVVIIPCFFHLVQCWWRNANKYGLRKKKIVEHTRVMIFNLKLIPFLKETEAIEFYHKIKDEFDQEEFIPFFDYFERNWLNLSEENDSKYKLDIWSYYGKFYFKETRKALISKDVLDKYIFISNNACESVNNLINNFIQINSKVSVDKFEMIIKTLFIRLECNRNNRNQNKERIIHKRVLSDILLEIINSGFGQNLKIIRLDQYKKLKNKQNENTIFKILNFDENKEDNDNDEC